MNLDYLLNGLGKDQSFSHAQQNEAQRQFAQQQVQFNEAQRQLAQQQAQFNEARFQKSHQFSQIKDFRVLSLPFSVSDTQFVELS